MYRRAETRERLREGDRGRRPQDAGPRTALHSGDGTAHSHAIEANPRKAAEMQRKARRAPGPADLDAAAYRFTLEVAERISQEVPAT